MSYRLFAFASLSEVQRLRQALLRTGGFVDMIRTPRRLRDKGCSFSLRADEDMAGVVRQEAARLGTEIRAEAEETDADTLRRSFADTDPDV